MNSTDKIVRFSTDTKSGNQLQFFYNPENNLVVIDLINKYETGGNELLRVTINEESMLKHCPKELETV